MYKLKKKKKKKNSQKINGLKKKGEPKAKPDIGFDAILLRRPRSGGPFPRTRTSPRFPKEKEISKRERSRAVDEDTKDKD
jgi:hypothetical protein